MGKATLVRGKVVPVPALPCLVYITLVAWSPGTNPHSPGVVPPPEGELVGPPPGRLHGFFFFLGPSRELRKKPALYRDVDTTFLGELKPLEGRGEGGLVVQPRLPGCDRA